MAADCMEKFRYRAFDGCCGADFVGFDMLGLSANRPYVRNMYVPYT